MGYAVPELISVSALRSGLWRDQVDRREIAAIAPDVAGQQRQVFGRSMRADEKVREHAGARAAGRTVTQISLAGEKQRRPRHGDEINAEIAKNRIDNINRWISSGHFGVDDIV